MYILRLEDENRKSNFINLNDFTQEIIAIPKSFYKENILIKGSVKTGKTQKIMLPMFFNLVPTASYKKIFFTTNCNIIDLKDYEYNCFILDTNTSIDKIVNAVENDKNVIVCLQTHLDTNFQMNLIKKIMEHLDKKFTMSFFFDELQYFPKNEYLLTIGSKNRFYLALQYSKQLLNCGYSREDVDFIKAHTKSIDTEKQYI